MQREDFSNNLKGSIIKWGPLLKLTLHKLMDVKVIELKPMVHQLLIQKQLEGLDVFKQNNRIRISIYIIRLNKIKLITILITQLILGSYL